MAKMSTTAARKDFSTVVNRAAFGKERVLLTRRGKGLVAVVPVEDLDLLEQLEDSLDGETATKALRQFKRSGKSSIPWAKVKTSLGL